MKHKAFHKLSYGLYIISTVYDNIKAGYIGNTVFQVTSSPPQITISCSKNNATTEKILQSRIFSVTVLAENCNTGLIGQFGFMSGTETDKFQNVQTKTSVTGAPIVLDSAVAWFDCKVTFTADVGTHMLITGLVEDSDILSDEAPLTYDYYREKYKMSAPVNAPTYIDRDKLKEEENTTDHEVKNRPGAKEQEESDSAAIYTCSICGYQYNPEEGDPTAGIPPGTSFEDLPEDYKCPVCNADKEYFRKT